MTMVLQQLNPSYGCSSILLGGLGESDLSGDKHPTPSFESFKKNMLRAFEVMDNVHKDRWGNNSGQGYVFTEADWDESDPDDLISEPTGRRGTRFTSFVVCSTTHRQPTVRKHLEELGFRPSGFDEEWNGKTNSRVQIYTIPTSALLETLGHDGIYIEKD